MNELIQTIKQITPYIWEVTIKQQKLEGRILLVLALLLFIFGLFDLSYEKRSRDKSERCFVVGGVTLISSLVFLIFGLLYLVNPAYWAIKDLLP